MVDKLTQLNFESKGPVKARLQKGMHMDSYTMHLEADTRRFMAYKILD